MKKIAMVTLMAVLISASCSAAPATNKITTGKVHSTIAKVVSWIGSWF